MPWGLRKANRGVVMAMVVAITIIGVITVVPHDSGDSDVGDGSSGEVVIMEKTICFWW